MTFKVNLDSSILISHLVGDSHKDDVLLAIEQLRRRKAELFFSLVCYAEVWTGVELMDNDEKKAQTTASFADIIQVNNLMVVADNVAIAKEAARAQAEVLNYAGRSEEALRMVEQAMRLNPRYPPWYLFNLGWTYFLTGRYAEAVATLQEVISRSPTIWLLTSIWLAATCGSRSFNRAWIPRHWSRHWRRCNGRWP